MTQSSELSIIPLGVTEGIDRAPALLLVRSEEEFLLEGADLGRLIHQAMDLACWSDEEKQRQ